MRLSRDPGEHVHRTGQRRGYVMPAAPPALRRDDARADQLKAGEEPRIVPGEWADLQQPPGLVRVCDRSVFRSASRACPFDPPAVPGQFPPGPDELIDQLVDLAEVLGHRPQLR